ncbi:MAG: SufD family Fe-S cluster assembly protein [Bacilli bacterium]|nr:SufD family Fe-S cluster assembly protein [Bacilli bacterium]
MKYILNETPIRTSNNFKINDITLDLNIEEKELSKINVKGEYKETIKENFNSRINLKHNKYRCINIEASKNIEITTELETNYLIDQININIRDNSNILIKYTGNGFSNSKLCINASKYSKANITVINMLSKDSIFLISFENSIDESSDININFIDLGGKVRVSNYYSVLERNSNNSFNNLYIGRDSDRIDMNYFMVNKGEKSNSNIEIAGALFDQSNKSFKGTIDFLEGSKNAIGYENENCLLFSNTSISKSLPMLLCHEEDVSGTHSVSTGKVDEDKLFYLTSKGIDEEEAKRLIMLGNFNKVLDRVDNKEEIINYIK